MRLQLTFIFFVIFGTENTSPALLVLEIITTFWRLGRHDGGWSNSSLFLAAGSVAVLSKEDLSNNSNIPMVNYLYLTDWSADCLLDLAITGLGWLLDSIAESATAGVSNSWFQFATELSRSRMFLSTVLMEGFSWTVDTIFNSLLTGLGLLLTTLIAALYILSKPWASHCSAPQN